jgi:hypothetical protein
MEGPELNTNAPDSREKLMRRLVITLAALVAVLMVSAAVATAAAPSDDFCATRPDHPRCPDSPPTTTQPPTTATCSDEMILSGTGGVGVECLWTPTNNGSPVGTVTVTEVSGSVSSLVVIVRDAAPGDICVLEQDLADQSGPSYETTFDLAYEDVPAGYEEWAGQTYWTFGGTHWCAPQDPVLDSTREDPNGEPLHLMVNLRAKKNTRISVSLFPGQATP